MAEHMHCAHSTHMCDAECTSSHSSQFCAPGSAACGERSEVDDKEAEDADDDEAALGVIESKEAATVVDDEVATDGDAVAWSMW